MKFQRQENEGEAKKETSVLKSTQDQDYHIKPQSITGSTGLLSPYDQSEQKPRGNSIESTQRLHRNLISTRHKEQITGSRKGGKRTDQNCWVGREKLAKKTEPQRSRSTTGV